MRLEVGIRVLREDPEPVASWAGGVGAESSREKGGCDISRAIDLLGLSLRSGVLRPARNRRNQPSERGYSI